MSRRAPWTPAPTGLGSPDDAASREVRDAWLEAWPSAREAIDADRALDERNEAAREALVSKLRARARRAW